MVAFRLVVVRPSEVVRLVVVPFRVEVEVPWEPLLVEASSKD